MPLSNLEIEDAWRFEGWTKLDRTPLLEIDIENSQIPPKRLLCTPLHGQGGSAGMMRILFEWLGCAA